MLFGQNLIHEGLGTVVSATAVLSRLINTNSSAEFECQGRHFQQLRAQGSKSVISVGSGKPRVLSKLDSPSSP